MTSAVPVGTQRLGPPARRSRRRAAGAEKAGRVGPKSSPSGAARRQPVECQEASGIGSAKSSPAKADRPARPPITGPCARAQTAGARPERDERTESGPSMINRIRRARVASRADTDLVRSVPGDAHSRGPGTNGTAASPAQPRLLSWARMSSTTPVAPARFLALANRWGDDRSADARQPSWPSP